MATSEYLNLQELQEVYLGLIVDFDAFCTERNLNYSLAYGTLLGAIRHKGFIPWDDDVDIMMPRADYERMLDLADTLENPLRRIVSARDHSFARNYARLLTLEYHKHEDKVLDDDCPWIGIDIFPVDTIPDDKALFEAQVNEHLKHWRMLSIATSPQGTGSTTAKRIARDLLRPVAKAKGSFAIAEKMIEICKRYDGTDGKDNAYVGGDALTDERWPKAAFVPTAPVEFCGHMFQGPNNPHAFLSAVFGDDYMQLPPEDKRKSNGILAWPADKSALAPADKLELEAADKSALAPAEGNE